ncbi:hypothetical protein FQR65_LT19468 [Abscondita terminalis]|nr:hypothetical protein FQR65_LT19468 [Abscondita terminalis]
MGTGGGPKEDNEIDTIDISIKELIGKQLTGFPSEFDDDREGIAVVQPPVVEFHQDEYVVSFCNQTDIPAVNAEHSEKNTSFKMGDNQGNNADHSSVTTIVNDWSSHNVTPQQLKNPTSTKLQVGKGYVFYTELTKIRTDVELVLTELQTTVQQNSFRLNSGLG